MPTSSDKWDRRFAELATLVAGWSKDPSSKVGAVAVDTNRNVISTGFNGFPRRILDLDERYEERAVKYRYILHAEQNLIANAAAHSSSLAGSCVYVAGLPPCGRCCLELIQADISQVVISLPVVDGLTHCNMKWVEEWHELSFPLLSEAQIEIRVLGEKSLSHSLH